MFSGLPIVTLSDANDLYASTAPRAADHKSQSGDRLFDCVIDVLSVAISNTYGGLREGCRRAPQATDGYLQASEFFTRLPTCPYRRVELIGLFVWHEMCVTLM